MKKTLTARELTLIGILTATTAVLAQIAIPLPFTTMPFSLGMIAVYMTGILLKPKHAVLTQLCYLLLGAVGVPVFGNFRGGIPALFGSTGGYLMVYPLMAFIVAYALNSRTSREAEKSVSGESAKSRIRLAVKAAVSICIAHTILYLGGTAWLSVITGMTFDKAMVMAVYPFIPFDIVKIIICVAVIVPMRSRLMAMHLLQLEHAPVNS